MSSIVRGGGTFVFVNNATAFPIQQFKLPIRNVVAGLRPEEFFLRGTIVQVTPDTTQQVMAGMPQQAAVFADSSPVFETEDGFTGTVLAKYADSGSPLLSGYLIGEKYLNGKAAALDVQLDAGHVILLGSSRVARSVVRHVQSAVQRAARGDDGKVAEARGWKLAVYLTTSRPFIFLHRASWDRLQ